MRWMMLFTLVGMLTCLPVAGAASWVPVGTDEVATPVRLFYHLEPWTMLQFDAKLLNDDGFVLATYPKVRALTAEDGSPERVIMEVIRQRPLGEKRV